MNWVRARDGSWVNLDHAERLKSEQKNDGWHVVAYLPTTAHSAPKVDIAVFEQHHEAAAFMARLCGESSTFDRVEAAKLFDPDYVVGDGR